jgi:phosphoribosyl-ATP pyrophosphohydrolase
MRTGSAAGNSDKVATLRTPATTGPAMTPRRIYRIYARAAADAETIRDFMQAQGQTSGTVNLLCQRNAAKLLAKWGEEMHELGGVLDGSHDDPYLMESTQTFYWASLYGAVQGITWEQLGFDQLRHQAGTCGISSVPELITAVDRLLAVPDAPPAKLFLLWNVADHLYRQQTPADQQWSLEQLMEADFQDMRKRPWMAPVIEMVGE